MTEKIDIVYTGGVIDGRPIVAFNREQILSLMIQIDKNTEAHIQFFVFLEGILKALEKQEVTYG